MLTPVRDYRLDPKTQSAQVEVFLATVIEISRARPESIRPLLRRFYTLLGKYCHILGPASPLLDPIRRAAGSPLSVGASHTSFHSIVAREAGIVD